MLVYMYGVCIIIILYGEYALSVLGFGTDCLAVGVLKTDHSHNVALLSRSVSCFFLTLVATERHVLVPRSCARPISAFTRVVVTIPPRFKPLCLLLLPRWRSLVWHLLRVLLLQSRYHLRAVHFA